MLIVQITIDEETILNQWKEGGDSDKEESCTQLTDIMPVKPPFSFPAVHSSGFQDIRLPQTKNLHSSFDESQHIWWTKIYIIHVTHFSLLFVATSTSPGRQEKKKVVSLAWYQWVECRTLPCLNRLHLHWLRMVSSSMVICTISMSTYQLRSWLCVTVYCSLPSQCRNFATLLSWPA